MPSTCVSTARHADRLGGFFFPCRRDRRARLGHVEEIKRANGYTRIIGWVSSPHIRLTWPGGEGTGHPHDPAAGCDATLRTSPRMRLRDRSPPRGQRPASHTACAARAMAWNSSCRCRILRTRPARRRGGGCAGPLHATSCGPCPRGCAGSSPVIRRPGPASSTSSVFEAVATGLPVDPALFRGGCPAQGAQTDHGDPAGSQRVRSAGRGLAPLRGAYRLRLAPDSRRGCLDRPPRPSVPAHSGSTSVRAG